MKRIISVLIAVLTLALSCVCVSAEQLPGIDHIDGVSYYNEDIYGEATDNTASVHIIEFDPAKGYVPLAYSGNGGSVCLAEDHVEAAIAEGYDVVGAINGSFFEMATGAPCGTLISDGKLVFSHSGLQGEAVAAFDRDGKCTLVTSTLRFTFQLAGKSVPSGIGLINKTYAACGLVKTTDITSKFHYYDIDAGDIADTTVEGYEVICEKQHGTELAVGETLKGNVVDIKEDSTYGATEINDENQFVIFVRADSGSVSKVTELEAGDTVSIGVKETNSGAITAMENASGAISSAYWLVKDGKDITDTSATIVHDTSLARAWTAFGTKEDGSYVFWASSEVDSEGENAISLKDVADAMIEMGCTNVIRLDGGGSTSMYAQGYDFPMASARKVCDVLLIVNKATLAPEVESAPETSAPETSEENSMPAEETSGNADISAEQEINAEEGSFSMPISPVIMAAIAGGVLIVALIIVIAVILKKRK